MRLRLDILSNQFSTAGIQCDLTRCVNKLTITNGLVVWTNRCRCMWGINLFLFHIVFHRQTSTYLPYKTTNSGNLVYQRDRIEMTSFTSILEGSRVWY